ncbi:hypothetical protein ACOSP7_005311 [Xanthoceras sorbifolium]
MAVASKNTDRRPPAPTKVNKRKPKENNMLICKKEICNDPGDFKCEKRKRTTFENVYDNEEAKLAVMERAKQVQANLAPQFPSLIKYMLQSHVTRGFWLGLSSKFCLEHLPRQDTTIILEDENGEEYKSKYLAEKVGLSAGWRAFSIAHKIGEGDVGIFHLVSPTKFKVYIVRSNGSDEVDGALGLLKLETCYRQLDSVKDISICKEEEDRYWEPLAQDIPREDFEKDRLMISSSNIEPVSDHSENESKDLGSEVLDGITLSESVVDFKDVKSIDDFSIVVNGLIINSTLSKHLITKYYELCCSQNSFLHDCLLEDLNCRLAVGMIAETINIADAIRASKFTSSQDNFAIWDKTLKAFKMMGMNVGFLQARLEQLMNLTSKSKRSREARLERASAEEERRILEAKISEARETINKLDSEIETLEGNADRLEVVFQEVAEAPW